MTYAFDPELTPAVGVLPGTALRDPARARAEVDRLLLEFGVSVDTTGLQVEDREVEGQDDQPAVGVRVYRPVGEAPPHGRAAVLYIHGGGFVTGSIETEHGLATELASELDVVVVSVEYRLGARASGPRGD